MKHLLPQSRLPSPWRHLQDLVLFFFLIVTIRVGGATDAYCGQYRDTAKYFTSSRQTIMFPKI